MINDIVEKMSLSEDFYSLAGASVEEIKSAEIALNLEFAEEYKSYLMAYGVASVDSHEFTGILSSERLHVVHNTIEERKNNELVAENLYVVEQLNIDHVIIWQSQTGEIYETIGKTPATKICQSLSEYLDWSK